MNTRLIIFIAAIALLLVAAPQCPKMDDSATTEPATNAPPLRVFAWSELAIRSSDTNLPTIFVELGYREDGMVVWRDRQ